MFSYALFWKVRQDKEEELWDHKTRDLKPTPIGSLSQMT